MAALERRKKLACHLRHLAVGVISNDAFEDAVAEEVSAGWLPEQYRRSKLAKDRPDDPVIAPLLELCWGLYDDTRCHTLTGPDALSKEALRVVARCILFLHSDSEYEWPYFYRNNPLFHFSWKDLILSILTLGHQYRDKREKQIVSYYEWQKLGDHDVWPFFRKADYNAQLQKQPFLNGRQAAKPGQA